MRSKRFARLGGGAGVGASRNVAQGPHLRAADHVTSTERNQRWEAATTGNKAPVSGHSRSLGLGFVHSLPPSCWLTFYTFFSIAVNSLLRCCRSRAPLLR